MFIQKLAIISLVCFSTLSCIKRPENFAVIEGTPLDYAVFSEALTEAFGETALSLKTNQFHAMKNTIQVADMAERTTSQIGQAVYCYDDKNDQYKIIQQLVTYGNNDEQKTSSTEYNFPQDVLKFTTSIYLVEILRLLCDSSLDFNKESNAVCSDLQIERYTTPPPPNVQKQENCGGVPNCMINKVKIRYYRTFDDVDISDNPVRNKMLYDVVISPDVPFLAKVLELCQQGIVEIDSKTKIYARICQRTTDFTSGQSSPQLCPEN